MARQVLAPGAGFVHEDGTDEILLPGGGFFLHNQEEGGLEFDLFSLFPPEDGMAQFRITQTTDIFAFEEITVSTDVVTFTQSVYKPTGRTRGSYALVTVEDAGIRFTMDGTAPTANTGHPLTAGSSLELEGPNQISNFKAIRSGGSNATLMVSYGR